MSAAEIWTSEFQDWDGWWHVSANAHAENDAIQFRCCELPPDSSPQLRQMAAQMCAGELAVELHAGH